jgi:hypothetical protein
LQDLHGGRLVDHRSLPPSPDATFGQPTGGDDGGHPLVGQPYGNGQDGARQSLGVATGLDGGRSLPASERDRKADHHLDDPVFGDQFGDPADAVVVRGARDGQ